MADKETDRLFLALAAVLIIVVVVFIFTFVIGRTPSNFTEVWLSNESSAIDEIGAGTAFDVSFVIKSSEAETTEYEYKIIAESQTKASGSIEINPGEEKTITESVSLQNLSEEKTKVLIEISKSDKDEPITVFFRVKVI